MDMAALDETAAATSREAAACGGPASPAWGEEAGSGSEGIPGMAEACRRFPLPSPDEAAHALRELSWGEHFFATMSSDELKKAIKEILLR